MAIEVFKNPAKFNYGNNTNIKFAVSYMFILFDKIITNKITLYLDGDHSQRRSNYSDSTRAFIHTPAFQHLG